jgi:hypothetical protein
MAKASSTWALNPELLEALAAGKTFNEWLAGRTPIASYERKSADHEGRQQGVQRQFLNNLENAIPNNCAVVKYYRDNHITAAKLDVKRPAFLHMVDELACRRTSEGYPIYGVIAVEKKRVFRLAKDFLALRDSIILPDKKGVFIDGQRQVDYNEFGNYIAGLVDAGAGEQEVKETGERRSRNIRDKALEGAPHGSRRRFGFLGADADLKRPNNRDANPEEWDEYRWVIDQGLAGRTNNIIAKELKARGVKTVQGGDWTGQTVNGILTNAAMCGYREINGELVRDRQTGEPVVGKWDIRATPEEWMTLKARADARKKPKAEAEGAEVIPFPAGPGTENDKTRKYLWSGFLRCGRVSNPEDPAEDHDTCFGTVSGKPGTTKHPRPAYYCISVHCKGLSRDMAGVDMFLTELVVTHLLDEFGDQVATVVPWDGQKLLDQAEEEKRELKRRYKAREIQGSDFFELLKDADARIKWMKKKRDEYLTKQAAQNMLMGFTRAKWDGMDIAQKRSAIAEVIEAVIVYPLPPGRWTRAPFDPNLLEVIWKTAEDAPQAQAGTEDGSETPLTA